MLIVMRLNLDPASLAELTAVPAASEELLAGGGWPLIILDVPDAAAARRLADIDITVLPAVVVACVPDPRGYPAAAARAADVILTEDERAPAPFVSWPGGPAAAAGLIEESLAAAPVAGTTLALLMRSAAGLTVPAALVAESAAFSTLQAGQEFARWRAAHPPRQPPAGDAARPRVRTRNAGGVFEVTLDRPGRRNAVDWRMRDALAAALAGPVSDADLRVELRGEGPDFCAGGDLDEFGSRPDPALAHLIRLTRSPALLLHRLAARTTVFLHGACLGAGIELPAFAGRVVASPDTRVGLPEIRLGLIPGAGGTASLPARIGRHRATFLALTGQVIGADQALDWGLVDAVESAPGEPG
jgi:enoyl-CoA hydratase/carnithine racemase